ncbi:hypothetical protein B0H13DRAFT_1927842 [Mycena leptocephala]|nr:hypothetical protein B0H13DRAFT_1927842 [Mycena leptocephala]
MAFSRYIDYFIGGNEPGKREFDLGQRERNIFQHKSNCPGMCLYEKHYYEQSISVSIDVKRRDGMIDTDNNGKVEKIRKRRGKKIKKLSGILEESNPGPIKCSSTYWYRSSKGLVQTKRFTEVRTKTRKREAGQKNKPSLLERKKRERNKNKPATSIGVLGESNPGPFELVETEL